MAERILIVDDDISLGNGFSKILRREGYVTDTSLGAHDALRRLSAASYDCILLDIVLLDLDGFALLRELNAKHPGAAVIMITGYPSVESALKSLRLGAFDYLIKPIKSEELIRRVREGIGLAGGNGRRRTRTADITGDLHALALIAHELARQTRITTGNARCLRDKLPDIAALDTGSLIASYAAHLEHAGRLSEKLTDRLLFIATRLCDKSPGPQPTAASSLLMTTRSSAG